MREKKSTKGEEANANSDEMFPSVLKQIRKINESDLY